MDPLTGVALGIGALSSLSQLLGGRSQMRAAERARREAIGEYLRGSAFNLGGAEGGSRRELYALGGALRDALGSQGAALGEAAARGGTWGSSAVGGALQRQGEVNAGVLGDAWRRLSGEMADRRQSVLDRVSGMRAEDAAASYASGSASAAGGVAGLVSLAGQLASLMPQKGGGSSPSRASGAPAGGGALGPVGIGLGTAGTPLNDAFRLTADPLQTWLQARSPSMAGSQAMGGAFGGGYGGKVQDPYSLTRGWRR